MTQDIAQLLENNRRWAHETSRQDEGFFRRLASQQSPRHLWIGCSDSRVPANQILGLPPGEVFVHRNVSNIAHPTDMNLMSVLEYAVDVLKVENVLVVGHYGCGGIRAALQGRLPGVADYWLEPVRDLRRRNAKKLQGLQARELEDRVCELNVLAQVDSLSHSGIVRNAWEQGRKLSIHGWIYRLDDGILQDLGDTRDRPVD